MVSIEGMSTAIKFAIYAYTHAPFRREPHSPFAEQSDAYVFSFSMEIGYMSVLWMPACDGSMM